MGLSVVLTVACSQDDSGNPTAAGGLVEAARGQTSTAAVVVEADDPSGTGPAIGTVVGRSHLTRTEDGLIGNVRTSGLTPGDVVTLWIVAFQNPDGCIGACDNPAEDIGPGNAALALAGGRVVRPSGMVTIAGKLDVGDATGGVVGAPGAPFFDTPIGSEVHLVIRTHGQVILGMVDVQTGSLNGGCPPNTCVNLQAAVHQP
ncbi:MAG: hypothetical protein ACREMD_11810 [Gemmatimonadota bacterium]